MIPRKHHGHGSCEDSCCLKITDLCVSFGTEEVLKDINLHMHCGQIVALIGPNGAGKTTAFNVITGVYAPTNGRVSFNEECIVRNHPTGKMKKQYKGEHADMYTARFAPEEELVRVSCRVVRS